MHGQTNQVVRPQAELNRGCRLRSISQISTSPRVCGAHRCHKALKPGDALTHHNRRARSTNPITVKYRKKNAERNQPLEMKKPCDTEHHNAWAKKSGCQVTNRTQTGLPRASHLANSKSLHLYNKARTACEGLPHMLSPFPFAEAQSKLDTFVLFVWHRFFLCVALLSMGGECAVFLGVAHLKGPHEILRG